MRSLSPGRVRAPWRSRERDVFAGPENGLDALADGSEMQLLADLVLALGPDVNSPKIHDLRAELLACISLVGQQLPRHVARSA